MDVENHPPAPTAAVGTDKVSPRADRTADDWRVKPPSLSLPKGGGAIRGVGEKFSAHPVMGTGVFSVPIDIPPGRSGFGPQLALTYNSGAGNGAFGLGWDLSLPQITRKTEKGLPRYQDAQESDVFILSGVEDLVPTLVQSSGHWSAETIPNQFLGTEEYYIKRYCPRVEGLFARVERWSNRNRREDVRWRSISRDNVTTWYGCDANSRIAEPNDSTHIFSWLVCQTHDDKGNVVVYNYISENDAGVDKTQGHECNRPAGARTAKRYLRNVRYGNRTPYFPKYGSNPAVSLPGDDDWMFSILLRYGENGYSVQSAPGADPTVVTSAFDLSPSVTTWPLRKDPFSDYRPTFEVRTYRLCRRIEIFHHFKSELQTAACLVKATEFAYDEDPAISTLSSVTPSGYLRQAESIYWQKSSPPVAFKYTKAKISAVVHEVDLSSLENLPSGLGGTNSRWVDLDAEGLHGVLTEVQGAWYYKRNVSALPLLNGSGSLENRARFGPLECVGQIPGLDASDSLRHQFLDLAGNGRVAAVAFGGLVPGFCERSNTNTWGPYRAFRFRPNIDWNDPSLRFIDLTGDGLPDVLIADDNVFSYYPSLGTDGLDRAAFIYQSFDEESGPRLLQDDASTAIFTADMSGDGLADLVRIRNDEVCYWPNLGYGRFGAKITFENVVPFDACDQFDPKMIRLADIDGSGTTDIIYLGRNRVSIYRNYSGNRLGDVELGVNFPSIDDITAIETCDLLGNGTACLVWSSLLNPDAGRQMRYVDLMGGQKPHLLVKTINNLGGETEISYAPSTRFYLADRSAGRPWATKLPFPVHCVERITVTDKWRGTRFSTTYSYHHGYFDGVEREFRGFGRVEQVDSESFGRFLQANAKSPYITSDKTLYQPPIKTVTWYHTGFSEDLSRVLGAFEKEYFKISGFKEIELPQPSIPNGLSNDEWREAVRAYKGTVLRQETFELDAQALARDQHVPVRLYSVNYHNSNIQCRQPRSGNRYAVFLVTESEGLGYLYELNLKSGGPDPRIAHTLNLKIDEFGQVLDSVTAVYPRIGTHVDPTLTNQQLDLIHSVQNREQHLMVSSVRFTDDILQMHTYRLRVPYQTQQWELTGVKPQGTIFTLVELQGLDPAGTGAAEISYQEVPNNTSAQKRGVESTRILFFADDLKTARPLGQQGALALPFETYRLALTDDLVDRALADTARQNAVYSVLTAQTAGYPTLGYYGGDALFPGAPITPTPLDEQYWIASGRSGYGTNASQHFYLPTVFTDAFGNATTLNYDVNDLYIASSVDPQGNRTEVTQFDFRILAARELKDANYNLTEIRFDILGLVVAIAIKGSGAEGDNFIGFNDQLANPTTSDLESFFTAPIFDDTEVTPTKWLGNATLRFIYYFGEKKDTSGTTQWAAHPASACSVAREKHVAQLSAAATSPLQIAFEYSDGLGNVFVKKNQAEPDPNDSSGKLRWIANGKTILNNKGKPVKQYEPYFSSDYRAEEPAEVGVTPLLYYDALGRLVRTELPDGTLTRVEFSPWHVRTFDANDAVRESQWYADRGSPDPSVAVPNGASADTRAAWLAAQHANTPAETILDSLGRGAIAIAHNRFKDATSNWHEEKYITYTKFDAEGKPLWIRDARGNLVMQFIAPAKAANNASDLMPTNCVPCYDLSGNLLYQFSMDAGERWMLMDAVGKPVLTWDVNETPAGDATARETRFYSHDYDSLHRPTALWLSVDGGASEMIERFEYQDAQLTDPKKLNGQLVRHYDSSGLAQVIRRDFKGNTQEVRRQLNNQPSEAMIDWQTNPGANLESETFVQISEFDALNRISRLYNWNLDAGNTVAVYERRYNRRGALDSEDIIVGATKTATTGYTEPTGARTTAIQSIRRNAKGQKEYLALGNGTLTQYDYDAATFRLKQIRTTRPADSNNFPQRRSNLQDASIVQQLLYTFDAVGNITQIDDQAYKPVFFDRGVAEPRGLYEYDALYRLNSATGRETAQGSDAARDGSAPVYGRGFPITDQTLRQYTETYEYDPVGNFVAVAHSVPTDTTSSWTRHYETFVDSNRLHYTWKGNNRTGTETEYHFDTHGNMLNIANVSLGQHLQWDYRDMVVGLDLVGGGSAYYQYDSNKHRIRKRVENQNGAGGYWERITLPGFELFRRYSGTNPSTPLESVEFHHLLEGARRVLLVEDILPKVAGGNRKTIFRYQYSNHLGSASLELDANAAIISYEEYHPYGASAYRAKNSAVEFSPKRYGFTGMERDVETGLNYQGARYYHLSLARWVSCDPALIAGGLNLYNYASSRPTALIDPSGRAPEPGSVLGKRDIYKDLDTAKGYIREHLLPGAHIEKSLKEYFPAKKVDAIIKTLYRRIETILLRSDIADLKTYGELKNGAGGVLSDNAASRLWDKFKESPERFYLATRARIYAAIKTGGVKLSPAQIEELDDVLKTNFHQLIQADFILQTARTIDKAKEKIREVIPKVGELLKKGLGIASKVSESKGAVAVVKFAKTGSKLLLGGVVVGLTVASTAEAANTGFAQYQKGEHGGAALTGVGASINVLASTPTPAGKVAAAFQTGMAAGELLNTTLDFDKAAAQGGEGAKTWAKWFGASEDTANSVGAVGSSIGALGDFAGLISNPNALSQRLSTNLQSYLQSLF